MFNGTFWVIYSMFRKKDQVPQIGIERYNQSKAKSFELDFQWFVRP